MAFFRKWKNHYGHKKFTSDDPNDAEDWGLQKPISNKELTLSNIDRLKLEIDAIDANEENDGLDGGDKSLTASYDLKYLGCTPIETKRSEKVTSDAIKIVVANSKAGGRKNKSQKRVKLIVSEDGIQVLDHSTQETLMRFSIYKISYCSVDAAHDHAFSFVSSETDPLTEEEKLSCHVFYCGKRKIAHEITLRVARCFEHAYQHWRDLVVQHEYKTKSRRTPESCDNKLNGVVESKAEIHYKQNQQNQQNQHNHQQNESQNANQNLLIDLAATDSDVRKFLQNTWVSFDDDRRDGLLAY